MTRKLLLLLVLFLGLVASYFFYDSNDMDTLDLNQTTHVNHPKVVDIPHISHNNQKQTTPNKTSKEEMPAMIDPIVIDKEKDPLTQEEIEKQTKAVYASLLPDNYDEIMEQASLAFEGISDITEEIYSLHQKEVDDIDNDITHDEEEIRQLLNET